MKPTTVTINKSSARYAEWMRVYGTDTVEVLSPAAERVRVRGRVREVYFLRLDALSTEQRERLVAHLAEKFLMSRAEVERDIEASGVPVLAEDSTCAFDWRLAQ